MSRSLWWKVGAVCVLVVLLVVVVKWFSADEVPASPLSSTPATSVIIVPGYGGGTSEFTDLQAALSAQSIPSTVLDIGDGHGDINSYAAQLQAATRAASGPVAWIGYSMGGVVTRAAFTADMAQRVSSMTTWSAPLHGTAVAQFATFAGMCDQACQQMTPGSPLMESIAPAPPVRLRWLSLFSPSDEIISPYTSSSAAGATNIDLGSCRPPVSPGHGQMPSTAVVVSMTVDNVLARPVPAC